ncbi:nitrite transporter NAR1 [Chlorella sorokiniana]|uniref:Nitrite transporter NAR1 n=1 Tax=Chlorella sorokiniana TaxID=3076 RepID=A0A2P6TTU8_CHLSO|nr:nitrite transporter NAR1 [Chlorella sorokiniana]|eukprot:PRW57490.1 nitrite transporter NAR1 [Chlorella sorokiniana]
MLATALKGGVLPLRAGARPIARRAAGARIVATAAPLQHAAASNGNGAAAQQPAVQQVAVTEPVTVAAPVQIMGVLPPAAVYQAAATAGAAKAAMPFTKTVMLGVVAGAYVGLCAALLMTVGPNCPGIAAQNPGLAKYITAAIGFPFVLLLILVCGAELFTGNTALLPAAVYEGKATVRQLLKNWVGSYLGNALGCALGVFLLLNCGLMPQFTNAINAISLAKVSYPFKETFIKAVMANWFVVLAVWQSLAAQTMGGKFIACLSGISAFVAIGLEHCIANMVFVPLGVLTGVPGVTWEKFIFNNLIPVTLGNIVAGSLCMATVYSLAYGSLGKKVWKQ